MAGRSTGRLTPAEVTVLEAAVPGRSIPEIAAYLNRSENTVKAHLERASRKLGATSRLGAVITASRQGYFPIYVGDEPHPPQYRWLIEVSGVDGKWREVPTDGSPYREKDKAMQAMDDLRVKRARMAFRVIRMTMSFEVEDEDDERLGG